MASLLEPWFNLVKEPLPISTPHVGFSFLPIFPPFLFSNFLPIVDLYLFVIPAEQLAELEKVELVGRIANCYHNQKTSKNLITLSVSKL